jgi:hypothetical protein
VHTHTRARARAHERSEADKLEEAESGAHESYAAELAGGGVGGADGQAAAVDKNAAVCVINAQGTIQMANKVRVRLLEQGVAGVAPTSLCLAHATRCRPDI